MAAGQITSIIRSAVWLKWKRDQAAHYTETVRNVQKQEKKEPNSRRTEIRVFERSWCPTKSTYFGQKLLRRRCQYRTLHCTNQTNQHTAVRRGTTCLLLYTHQAAAQLILQYTTMAATMCFFSYSNRLASLLSLTALLLSSSCSDAHANRKV